jgi:hypothetical protein
MTLHGKMPAPASTPYGRPTATATTRVIYSARFPEIATHWNHFESTFNQDLNGDGVTGLNPLVIQTDTGAFGSTSLARLDNIYFLYAAGGTTGPELQYNGAAVTSGKFGGWNPIGAVQTASGYDVAWQWSNSNLFTVWTTDSNGNYTGNLIGAVSGNSYTLESLESTFNQDLNGDGVTGLNPLIIQTDTSASGSTSLTEIGGNYFLFATGGTTGPELQYNGAAVTSGEFGGWNPIGAVQTANGYEIAWKYGSQYAVWTTDNNGDYTGNLIGAVSGNSYALESLESAFNQDLNGDGVTGLNPVIIQTDMNALDRLVSRRLTTIICCLRPAARPGLSCITTRRPSRAQSSAAGIRSGQCRPRVATMLLGSGRTVISLQCGRPTATVTTPAISSAQCPETATHWNRLSPLLTKT